MWYVFDKRKNSDRLHLVDVVKTEEAAQELVNFMAFQFGEHFFYYKAG